MTKPDVAAQTKFGSDGLEVEESTETDLTDWDFYEPGPERETRIEQSGSDDLVDDRSHSEVEAGEQTQLFVSRDEQQQTLNGKTGGMEAQYE